MYLESSNYSPKCAILFLQRPKTEMRQKHRKDISLDEPWALKSITAPEAWWYRRQPSAGLKYSKFSVVDELRRAEH